MKKKRDVQQLTANIPIILRRQEGTHDEELIPGNIELFLGDNIFGKVAHKWANRPLWLKGS